MKLKPYTVQELIDELSALPDKSLPIVVADECHIHDKFYVDNRYDDLHKIILRSFED